MKKEKKEGVGLSCVAMERTELDKPVRTSHRKEIWLNEKSFKQLVMSSYRIKRSEPPSVNVFKLLRHNRYLIPMSLSTFQL